MKISLKILMGLLATLACVMGYMFLGEEVNNSPTIHTAEQKKVVFVEHLANNAVDNQLNAVEYKEQPSSTSAKKEARIQALKDKAQKAYRDILSLTGSTGKQEFSYEDNWCMAAEDLSEEDFVYADKQMDEWMLSRGYTSPKKEIRGIQTNGINDAFLDAYREADKETLIRLANKDDMLALTTIVQSYDKEEFDNETRGKAAEQLVIIGDTSFGLGKLVIDRLISARYAKEDGKEPIDYLKGALVLVEYGLMRQDASTLRTFISHVVDYEKSLGGLNPAELLTENDFVDIRAAARLYYEDVNKARITKGLPSFEEIDEPKVAKIHYAQTLSLLYDKNSETLESAIFPSSWKDTYLKRTPCVTRMIAMDDFLTEELPAIQSEIAMLKRQLN